MGLWKWPSPWPPWQMKLSPCADEMCSGVLRGHSLVPDVAGADDRLSTGFYCMWQPELGSSSCKWEATALVR